MAVKISSYQELDYIVIQASGVLKDSGDVEHYIEQLYQEAIEAGIDKLIIDERQVKFSCSIVDLSKAVESIPAETRTWYVATVSNKLDQEKLDFWALYYQNRGYNFKQYYSFEEAQNYMQSLDKIP